MSQPSDDHLKALWQGQHTETPTMTAIAIRALARNYGDSIRGRIWIGLTIGAFEVVVLGLYAWRASNDVLRIGYLIILGGVGWITWRILGKRPGRLPPPEASAQALIDFHRAELERQRTNFRWMIVSAAPMFIGMAVTLVGMQKARPNMTLANIAPMLVLIVLWFIAAFVLNRRQAKRLAEQIAEMDDLAGR
jgi:hypothetical protein